MSSSTDTASADLVFQVVDTGQPVGLRNFTAVVAGYTARDESAVQAHIDELAAIGVPPPDSVPAFYPVDSALVTQDDTVQVGGGNTSGEVEPVLVRIDGKLYLGVGSDHTDRDIERTSIHEAKKACPKPISRSLVSLTDAMARHWDAITVRSSVDGRLYQEGTLASLRPTTEVLRLYADACGDDGEDLVIFGGTLAVIGGTFIAGAAWTVSMTMPDSTALEHAYRVSPASA